MSDLKFNSIAGAVIGSVLAVMGIGIVAETLVKPHYPEKAAWAPEVDLTASSGGPAAPAGPPDFGRLYSDPAQLATLVAAGQRVSGQCASCHDFTAGGPNKTGPNLHDVFGRHSATHPGFDYSDAMKAHNVTWEYLTLNEFLRSPGSVVRGTRMGFAGLHNDQDREAIIAYLRSISPNNVPLPAPLPEAAPASTTPAAGSATAPAAGASTTAAPAATAPAAHH